MKLTDFDANLYRLYAVGLLGYEEALGQAQSMVRLRSAMLAFDQNTRVQGSGLSKSPSSAARP